MKWDHKKSIVLSKVSVIIFFVLYIGVLFICTDISRFSARISYWIFSGLSEDYVLFLCRTVYICAIPIGLILIILYRLIQSIGDEQIFTDANIRRLRIISWLCILVALICVIASVWGIFFLFIAACAAFMGILLRVIKNVFERAQEIKQENDYTI
ncbi:MAG: DUF2975 domain-containing protein [Suipraeoptans sp.]